MNTIAKIFNKNQEDKSDNEYKGLHTMTKWGLYQEHQDSSTSEN